MTTHTYLLHDSRAATNATFRAAQRPERVINHVVPDKRIDRQLRSDLILAAMKVGLPFLGVAYLLA